MKKLDWERCFNCPLHAEHERRMENLEHVYRTAYEEAIARCKALEVENRKLRKLKENRVVSQHPSEILGLLHALKVLAAELEVVARKMRGSYAEAAAEMASAVLRLVEDFERQEKKEWQGTST